MADTKAPIVSPEGRVINSSMFERDVYKDPKSGAEGKPLYKVEMAFDPDDPEFEDFEAAMIEAAEAEFGSDAVSMLDAGDLLDPFLDGDELAAAREAKGKKGDAYKGKLVLRANTQFDKDGNEGTAGIYVAGEDGKELPFTDRGNIYNGCQGRVAVKFGTYPATGRGTKPGVKAYLVGFQRTGDGERLTSNAAEGAFKPVGRSEGEGTSRRRQRKG